MGADMSTEARGVRRIAAVGLIVAAVGIGLQRVAGVEMPVVPPGLVLLVVAAGLIAFTRWRWAPAVGVLVALAEAVALAVGGAAGLVDTGAAGVLLSTWVRAIGVVIALIAGVAALRTSRPVRASRR
jgi:hypothetical protein